MFWLLRRKLVSDRRLRNLVLLLVRRVWVSQYADELASSPKLHVPCSKKKENGSEAYNIVTHSPVTHLRLSLYKIRKAVGVPVFSGSALYPYKLFLAAAAERTLVYETFAILGVSLGFGGSRSLIRPYGRNKAYICSCDSSGPDLNSTRRSRDGKRFRISSNPVQDIR